MYSALTWTTQDQTPYDLETVPRRFGVLFYTQAHPRKTSPAYRCPLSPVGVDLTSTRQSDAGWPRVGMEMFDPTTFQPARLMFWPSTPKDGVFYADSLDAPWLDVDSVLLEYMDLVGCVRVAKGRSGKPERKKSPCEAGGPHHQKKVA